VTVEQVNAFARGRLGIENRASLLFVPRDSGIDSPARELAAAGVQ
jgi:hypothetical protein